MSLNQNCRPLFCFYWLMSLFYRLEIKVDTFYKGMFSIYNGFLVLGWTHCQLCFSNKKGIDWSFDLILHSSKSNKVFQIGNKANQGIRIESFFESLVCEFSREFVSFLFFLDFHITLIVIYWEKRRLFWKKKKRWAKYNFYIE